MVALILVDNTDIRRKILFIYDAMFAHILQTASHNKIGQTQTKICHLRKKYLYIKPDKR